MKIILKDNQEIEVTDVSTNYNPNVSEEDVKNSISFTIEDENVTVDDLIKMLTKENLSSIQIVSSSKTITKENVKLSNIIESISDVRYSISVRATVL